MNQETKPAANETLRRITHRGRWTRSSTNSAPAKYLLEQKLSFYPNLSGTRCFTTAGRSEPHNLGLTFDHKSWPCRASVSICRSAAASFLRLMCANATRWRGRMTVQQAVTAIIWWQANTWGSHRAAQPPGTFRSTPPSSQTHWGNWNFNTVNHRYPNKPKLNFNLNMYQVQVYTHTHSLGLIKNTCLHTKMAEKWCKDTQLEMACLHISKSLQ